MAAIHDIGMTRFTILERNSTAEECAHFIDDLAAARDRLQIPADAIIVLDNVRFHHSAIVIEMLELRGFEHKLLPPYSPFFNSIECMFSERKQILEIESDLSERKQILEIESMHLN